MDKLNRQCKACDDKSAIVEEAFPFGYTVKCKTCGVETGEMDSREEAIAEWNKNFAAVIADPAATVPSKPAK